MAIGKLRALAIGVAALALAAPATAAAPSVVIEEVDRTRTLPAGDLCDFDVVLHSEGTRRTTTYTDQEGSFDRFAVHLSALEDELHEPGHRRHDPHGPRRPGDRRGARRRHRAGSHSR